MARTDGGRRNPTGVIRPLLRHRMIGRPHRAGGGGIRDRERRPSVPAGRAVGGVELPVSFQAQKCLIVLSYLRAHTENARAEAAENGRLTEVVGDLLIGISLG